MTSLRGMEVRFGGEAVGEGEKCVRREGWVMVMSSCSVLERPQSMKVIFRGEIWGLGVLVERDWSCWWR